VFLTLAIGGVKKGFTSWNPCCEWILSYTDGVQGDGWML